MKTLHWMALVTFVATGTLSAGAATIPLVKTNWVSNLNFTLTAWKDGSATPSRAASKDIIASFNGTTLGSNVISFPATAHLLLKQTLSTNPVVVNNLGTNTQIIVRNVVSGKNDDTDVSSFFDRSNTFSATTSSTTGTAKHSVGSLSMENNKLSFDLSSFTTETDGKITGSSVDGLKQFGAAVSGTGNSNGTPVAISGTITASGGRLE